MLENNFMNQSSHLYVMARFTWKACLKLENSLFSLNLRCLRVMEGKLDENSELFLPFLIQFTLELKLVAFSL